MAEIKVELDTGAVKHDLIQRLNAAIDAMSAAKNIAEWNAAYEAHEAAYTLLIKIEEDPEKRTVLEAGNSMFEMAALACAVTIVCGKEKEDEQRSD